MTSFLVDSALGSAVSPHLDFLPVCPVIQRHARITFRHLPLVEREEAIAEAIAAGFVSFVRLKDRDRAPAGYPGAIAKFAVLHVKNGRRVGNKFNSRDVCSRRHRDRRSPNRGSIASPAEGWEEFLTDDSLTPILDQVAFRLDWPAFLTSLSWRHRQILHALASGHSGKWVAHRFNLSQPRITQLRQQWRREWLAFIGVNPQI